MRIAFLSPSGELGGAERCLVDVVASLARAKACPVLCVLAGADGPLLERIRGLGVDARVVPMPSSLWSAGESALRFHGGVAQRAATLLLAPCALWGALRHARDLRRALAAFRPDVVHTNGMKHHVLGALAAPRGAHVVWHVRDLVSERPVMLRLLRLMGPRASGAIAISRAVGEDLARALPGLRAEVVYDAIDVDEFSPGPAEPDRLDALAGFAPGPALRIGLVATYARWKGHEVFLEAARHTAAVTDGRPLRFYVVGGPIYATADSQYAEPELREAAERLGIADRVGFVPFQRDPAWVFRTLDVAVHASTRFEPFGRTIAEALACGCPVVATRTSGAVELLATEGAAFLVPPSDAHALSHALGRVITNPHRDAAARRARRAAAERFGRARIAEELLGSYRALGTSSVRHVRHPR